MQPSGKAWAHVRYTDGDEEDIRLSSLPNYLVKPLDPLPESELQRPRDKNKDKVSEAEAVGVVWWDWGVSLLLR